MKENFYHNVRKFYQLKWCYFFIITSSQALLLSWKHFAQTHDTVMLQKALAIEERWFSTKFTLPSKQHMKPRTCASIRAKSVAEADKPWANWVCEAKILNLINICVVLSKFAFVFFVPEGKQSKMNKINSLYCTNQSLLPSYSLFFCI